MFFIFKKDSKKLSEVAASVIEDIEQNKWAIDRHTIINHRSYCTYCSKNIRYSLRLINKQFGFLKIRLRLCLSYNNLNHNFNKRECIEILKALNNNIERTKKLEEEIEKQKSNQLLKQLFPNLQI